MYVQSVGTQVVTRAWRGVGRLRWALLLATLLLVGGLALGFVVHDPAAASAGGTADSLYDFEDPTVLDIAGNNLAVMVLLVGGWVTLGSLTVSGLLYNGFVLGTVLRTLQATSASPLDIALLVVPHAVFELGGLVLASAVAFRGTWNVISYLLAKRETPLTGADLHHAAVSLVVATLLIVGAAVVEVHVTPALG